MNRREALSAATLFGLSTLPRKLSAAVPLPSLSLFEQSPEEYWLRLRKEQFLLPDARVFLNNGSLGVTPRPVLQAVVDFMTQSASLRSDEYPRWGYETLDEHRREMAEFLGCSKDELAFMHNATEAMSTIAGGLDLKPGDEVLITDQEHPSGRGPWYQKAARYGITVREVKIPLPPKSSGELADVVVSAIGSRTRVLSFSGILTTTGTVMPVRAICDAARSKGVLTVVDGAHMNGQIPVKLSELGCDYYAGSPHKWLFAPAGCGLLYIREEAMDRLWANTVTGNWDDKKLKAARFMMVGTNNRAIFEGMRAGVRFLREIGPERVYGRIHDLAKLARQKFSALPQLAMITPEDDRLCGSLVSWRFPKDANLVPLWEYCKEHKIWPYQSAQLRLSTHIHTRVADLDAFAEAIRQTVNA